MFRNFKDIFKKTTQGISQTLGIRTQKIPRELLEEALIQSDIDYDLVEMILENLSGEVSRDELEVALLRFFRAESYYDKIQYTPLHSYPQATLVIGVNGAGKTTTIAKLAKRKQKDGKRVLLCAGDTFRAAAIEQMKLWGEKLGIDVVSSKIGHDPSSIAFDAIKSGLAKKVDEIIIDTAGRLHNQTNLKNELIKITQVCQKALEGRSLQKFLVLDGTQGSSAIAQAKIFHQMLDVDAIIVTKLDSTSKGGAIMSMIYELKLPVAYIGVGEGEDDLIAFDEEEFIQTLLDGIFSQI